MYKIIFKQELAPKIKLIEVSAPRIAQNAKPGQFVILRIDKNGERFPLTLFDWNLKKGTIKLIFLEVGLSTRKLGLLKVDENILDVAGPLGNPSEIAKFGSVAVIGGGVVIGVAIVILIRRKRK